MKICIPEGQKLFVWISHREFRNLILAKNEEEAVELIIDLRVKAQELGYGQEAREEAALWFEREDDLYCIEDLIPITKP